MAKLPMIAHLENLRRSLVEGGPPLPEMTLRLLCDTLGLGNLEVFRFLTGEQPDQARFEAWVLDTAGVPNPVLLARYQARMLGTPLPEEAAAKLNAIDALDDVFTSDQLQQWDADGYVVLPQAISRKQCAQVAQLVWEALGADPDNPASWSVSNSEGIMVPLFRHPALDHARRSPRVHKAFAQLWSTPDLWVTIDRLGFNPPELHGGRFRGSPLHWDVSLARPIPFATQAVLYLTDTAADQGAFRCVPGFHHRIEAWLDEVGEDAAREIDLSAGAHCVAGQAGDLVIWRQDLPHGASPNHAERPRLVQYLNFYAPDLMVQPRWV